MTKIHYIELLDRIGTGGAGHIYQGYNTQDGSMVAVKVLWDNLFENSDMRRRFIEEANHYIYLDHKNIVQLRDFIATDNASYLVMEFVEGQNLETYINRTTGPIPGTHAKAIFLQVLSGIAYAHEQGVLHLDIKPSNIMITSESHVKIIDFGIASKVVDFKKNTLIMGSPLYMSPEHTLGKGLDERSDIYSLGITFFQMLTGTTPYPVNINRNELFRRIQKGDNMPLARDFYPFVSDAAQQIITTATQTDKTKRFQTVKEFMEALKNAAL